MDIGVELFDTEVAATKLGPALAAPSSRRPAAGQLNDPGKSLSFPSQERASGTWQCDEIVLGLLTPPWPTVRTPHVLPPFW